MAGAWGLVVMSWGHGGSLGREPLPWDHGGAGFLFAGRGAHIHRYIRLSIPVDIIESVEETKAAIHNPQLPSK